MPVFYNFTQSGLTYSFDDIFVPADLFREGNLWVWGSNTSGRLGNFATTGTRSTPVTTFAGGTNWKTLGFLRFYSGPGIFTAIKTSDDLQGI